MKMNLFLTAGLSLIATVSSAVEYGEHTRRREDFQQRYKLKDTQEKLIDNRGNGFDTLYGARNFRFVMQGFMYRGGANNKYHRKNPRSNTNPLQRDALENLCEEGFSEAIYLYTKNWNPKNEVIKCRKRNADGSREENTLRYRALSPFTASAHKKAIEIIYQSIANPSKGPVYSHCWNGWHASGLVAATALMQFCGVSGSEAVRYWNANADGNNGPDYEHIRKRVRNFKPFAEYQIPDSVKKEICPNYHDELLN